MNGLSSKGFVSPLQRAVAAAPEQVNGLRGREWGAWLRGNAAKLGVKQDEVLWSGVEEYLALRADVRLEKDEISGFLRENGVKVQDLVRGAPLVDLPKGWTVEQDQYGIWEVRNDRNSPVGTPQRTREAALSVMPSSVTPTKYGRYVLPGGANYRELLITLPLRNGDGEAFSKAEQFKSPHWDETNVLAHLRFDDRVDVDGKKVLMIHEIQSDWGQQAKKHGVQTGQLPVGWHFVKSGRGGDEGRAWQVVKDDGRLWNNGFELFGDQDNALKILLSQIEREKVPAAPFVSDTKAWVGLAVKRAISYAAEKGYGSVAFVNGEQAAGFYDLSKQVDRILHGRHEQNLFVTVYGKNDDVIYKNLQQDPSSLQDVVGKEVAESILNDEGVCPPGYPSHYREISGKGLKIGGAGMRAFYDQIVPQVVNDVLRKLGEGKAGKVLVPVAAGQGVDVALVDRTHWGVREKDRWVGENDSRPYSVADALRFPSREAAIDEARKIAPMFSQIGFEISPTLRERVVKEGVPLFQFASGLDSPPRASFDRLSFTMTLFEAADRSSFIHEAGHFYLEASVDLASQASAPEALVSDMGKVFQWMGVDGGMAGWQRLDALGQAPFHEQFARAFEAYLMVAQPPVPELEGMFASAREWLTEVYRDVSELGVLLTPEITEFFDKLVMPGKDRETVRIRESIGLNLDELDLFPKETNRLYASLVANFYAALATASGLATAELVERFPLTIQEDLSGLLPGGVEKTRTRSDEFREWFGDTVSEKKLEADAVEWERQFSNFVNFSGNAGRPLVVSETYGALLAVGVPQANITITRSLLAKAFIDGNDVCPGTMNAGKHCLSEKALLQLPTKLANPIAIFRSKKTASNGEPAFEVMLDLKDNDGDTVLAAVYVNQKSGWNCVHAISTIPGKDRDAWFVGCAKAGDLLYIDQQKSLAWSHSTGLLLSPESYAKQGNYSVLTDANIAKPFRSKVVTPEGTPLRVFQTIDFPNLNVFQFRESVGWFSTSPEFSSNYAEKAKSDDVEVNGVSSPNELPVFLSIKNPLLLPFDINGSPKEALDFLPKIGLDNYRFHFAESAFEVVSHELFFKAVKEHGFDGIGIKVRGTLMWAPIAESQIRSVFNRGALNSENPNIIRQAAVPPVVTADGWKAAESLADALGVLKEVPLPTDVALALCKGTHFGSVQAVTLSHVIQLAGQGKLVAHPLEDFERVPVIGEPLVVKYVNGRASVQGLLEKSLDRGR